MKQPGVYILQSLKNNRYYVGSTDDVERRLQEHNEGKSGATRYLRPLKLCLFWPCDSLIKARGLEYKIKQLKSRKIIEKIVLDQKINLGV